jgi:hypothetical protein
MKKQFPVSSFQFPGWKLCSRTRVLETGNRLLETA